MDYQALRYYSAPKFKKQLNSLDEVDPAVLATFEKLGISLNEQKRLANVKNVAMDAVFDSVSIATTFKEELSKAGVIFCSISEAVREMPDLVRKHLGSVVRPLPPSRQPGPQAALHRACSAARTAHRETTDRFDPKLSAGYSWY